MNQCFALNHLNQSVTTACLKPLPTINLKILSRVASEAAVSLKYIQTLEDVEILTVHKSTLDMIESTELLSLLEEFENKMQNKAKFLCNYIKMITDAVCKSNHISAIGADHALEQENRGMKVIGGIKGIRDNQVALDRHFLIVFFY